MSDNGGHDLAAALAQNKADRAKDAKTKHDPSNGQFTGGAGGGSSKPDTSTAEGQMRLMRESVGQEYAPRTIDLNDKSDHGADPLGNGKFRMVPSGEIVDLEERNNRLKRFHK